MTPASDSLNCPECGCLIVKNIRVLADRVHHRDIRCPRCISIVLTKFQLINLLEELPPTLSVQSENYIKVSERRPAAPGIR